MERRPDIALDRPRLGDHVRARWHVVSGERPFVVLHDERGRALRIGAREWAILRAADGTRDPDGIRLAAARAGVKVAAAQIDEFLEQLRGLGFFEQLTEPAEDAPAFARDVPVVTLPGYRFRCTGIGKCCSSFGTILFRPIDVARARAAVPELDPVFMPAHGMEAHFSAVSQQDGACAYLASDGRCRIHASGGESAKPVGCRTFPSRYVDLGDEIRVTARLECACIFESAKNDDGELLSAATRGSELPREAYAPQIPSVLRVGAHRMPRAAVVALCDSLEVPAEGDLAALCWELAAQFSTELAATDALARVVSSAERLIAQVSWRAPSDVVLDVARHTIAAARQVTRALPEARDRDDEAFYLRASFFAVLGVERPFEADLRRLALVLWIARAFPPEIQHPIALVEMLARGHGLNLETD